MHFSAGNQVESPAEFPDMTHDATIDYLPTTPSLGLLSLTNNVHFYAGWLNKRRTVSTRLRFTPKSERPRREAERT